MQQSQNLSAPGQTRDANAMAAALCFKESYQPAGTCDADEPVMILTSAEDRQQIREVGRDPLGCVQGFAPAQPGSSVQVSSVLVCWEHACS